MGLSKRILVVDDEEGLRMSLAANFELEGFEVVEAQSGEEAIDLVRQQEFDAMLCDIRMPGINGVDAFRVAKSIRPDLAVIMMTAFATEELVEQAIAEGTYTVLHKPFRMEQVFRVIKRAIRGPLVLVVDDVAADAGSIVEALRAAGLRTEAVTDGETAARLVGDRHVDVCVLDLVMPGLDGLQTYERIRQIDGSVAVIAMSGYSVPEMMHGVMARGGYVCLRKPFDMGELVRTIAEVRASHGAG